MLKGIKNTGNQCFLNSLLICLANTITKQYSQNQFQQYLLDTLNYINECDDIKDLNLFHIELRKRLPALFPSDPTQQQPQDANEILYYLLNEADLLNSFTIINDSPYCQIPERKNCIHIHKNWTTELIYYVWNPTIKKKELEMHLNLHKKKEKIIQYKIVNHQKMEWLKDEQFDFDIFEYHCEVEPINYLFQIEIILQYVENDQTVTLNLPRSLYLQDEINQRQLYSMIRSQLNAIKFDLYNQHGYIEEIDENWQIESPIYLVFRTEDLDQFLWCKQLDTPKFAINYKNFQDIPLDCQESDYLILILQRMNKTKNTNPYFLRESLFVNNRQYNLQGICCHLGDPQFGHYISYVIRNGLWQMWDDEKVESRDIDYQCLESCYLLFYR